MSPRLTRAEFVHRQGAANRRAFKRIVQTGEPPGILAYSDDAPIGWCALAPREIYIRLERSRVLQPVDDQPVWSVVCFFVAKGYRRQGVSVKLLKAATAYAKSRGARTVEGYPFDYKSKQTPDPFVWTGLVGAFREAGFTEVLRRSPSRPIMRYHCTKSIRSRKSLQAGAPGHVK